MAHQGAYRGHAQRAEQEGSWATIAALDGWCLRGKEGHPASFCRLFVAARSAGYAADPDSRGAYPDAGCYRRSHRGSCGEAALDVLHRRRRLGGEVVAGSGSRPGSPAMRRAMRWSFGHG